MNDLRSFLAMRHDSNRSFAISKPRSKAATETGRRCHDICRDDENRHAIRRGAITTNSFGAKNAKFGPKATRQIERLLPIIYVLFGTVLGCHLVAGQVPSEKSVKVVEKHQRSVTDDPAVKGKLSNGWLVPGAGVGLPQPTPTESDLLEWVKLFKKTQAPQVVEENLSPGARRMVQLQIAGPSGLFGSARWVGAIRPLGVIIALNGSTLTTGAAYHVGSNRGGSYLQARTKTGGLATMSVTNTSGVTVKVRIVFTATGL